MYTDEDPIVLRMRGYTPPPGFDPAAALAAGQRSVRRRRWATVATVAAALVAVAGVAAVATAPSPDAPDVRPAEVSPSGSPTATPSASATWSPPAASSPPPIGTSLSVVPPRALSSTGTMSCTPTPLELPAGGGRAEVYGVSPDSQFIVGAIHSAAGRKPLVWHEGRLETTDQAAQWLVANRSGVLAGIKSTADHIRAYIRRDSQVRELPTPSGYRAAVPMAVTADGDVFGTLRRGEMVFGDGPTPGGYNFHNDGTARDLDVVVWPAASPDAPRVIPDPGEATVVGVAGPDRMFAAVQVGRSAQRPYSWSVTREGGPLALPSGWTGLYLQAAIGGFLFGTRDTGTVVRWNLASGRIETFTGASTVVAANGNGWFAATTGHTASALLVGMDGTVRTLPAGTPQWIGADGRSAIGTDTSNTPVAWQCR